MDTTLYNDARPADGQDELERRRAEQERSDLETITRFYELTQRLNTTRQISQGSAEMIRRACVSLALLIPLLLDREGY